MLWTCGNWQITTRSPGRRVIVYIVDAEYIKKRKPNQPLRTCKITAGRKLQQRTYSDVLLQNLNIAHMTAQSEA